MMRLKVYDSMPRFKTILLYLDALLVCPPSPCATFLNVLFTCLLTTNVKPPRSSPPLSARPTPKICTSKDSGASQKGCFHACMKSCWCASTMATREDGCQLLLHDQSPPSIRPETHICNSSSPMGARTWTARVGCQARVKAILQSQP